MALPMLLNGGAECGPSNPLQGFSKQFDQDRGPAHDRFEGKPGPSTSTFRTRPSGAAVNPLEQDAMRFMGPMPGAGQTMTFDVGALRGALPLVSAAPAPAASGWATDFARAAGGMAAPSVAGAGAEWALQMQAQSGIERAAALPAQMQRMDVASIQRSMAYTPTGMMNMSTFNQFQPSPMHPPEPQIVFPDFEQVQPVHPEPAPTTNPVSNPQERSELAETARQLLEALEHETRPKFRNSQFMGLMRQLRDGQVVVQDGEMVPASEARPTVETTSDKGKAKAVPGQPLQRRKSVHFDSADPSSLGTEQESDDAFDNAGLFYDVYDRTRRSVAMPTAQTNEWAQLQEDWDAFEATASGIKPVKPQRYRFQKNNPYLAGTRTHEMHRHGPGLQQSVLEHEAAVQRDPADAQAWLALGVKQQENEREQHAIDALCEAVLQDPLCMPAYLALAVSYANEGDKVSVHKAIGDWMAGRGAKVRKVGGLGELGVVEGVASVDEIHQEYVSGLLSMARQSPNGEIDADIQMVLGVLLNTMDDYVKAQDCFRTALAVRPDDWLLFNRVGATLANSGNPSEAVPFYYKALELNPGYIRARYNLGISCVSLRRYDEAAQHLVDALVLQESEGANSERGVTSDSLWDTLRSTCLSLQRVDLAVLCESRDLQKFIDKFHQADPHVTS